MTLDNVSLSLQSCMLEIMKVKGQNCYKILHIGKASLRRSAQLPENLQVPLELFNECISYLRAEDSIEGLEYQGYRYVKTKVADCEDWCIYVLV